MMYLCVFLIFGLVYCEGMMVNGMADVILQEIVRKMPKDKVDLPDIDKSVKGGLKLRAEGGWLGMLTTLRRSGNAVIDSTHENTDIQLHVGLSRMEFGFNSYSLSAGSVNLLSGRLNGSIAHNSLYMRLILDHPEDSPCQVKVQDVELKEIEDAKVRLTGMGVLNTLYSQLVSWSVNKYLEKNKELVSSEIEKVFKRAILKHDICGIAKGSYSNIK